LARNAVSSAWPSAVTATCSSVPGDSFISDALISASIAASTASWS